MCSRVRPRLDFTVARVVVCLAALLVQATLLPLAHACHGGVLDSEDGALQTRAVGAANALRVAHAGAAVPRHNAATCPLCTVLAHGRSGILTATLGAPAPQVALGQPFPAAAVWNDTTAPTLGRPRAPPAFVA